MKDRAPDGAPAFDPYPLLIELEREVRAYGRFLASVRAEVGAANLGDAKNRDCHDRLIAHLDDAIDRIAHKEGDRAQLAINGFRTEHLLIARHTRELIADHWIAAMRADIQVEQDVAIHLEQSGVTPEDASRCDAAVARKQALLEVALDAAEGWNRAVDEHDLDLASDCWRRLSEARADCHAIRVFLAQQPRSLADRGTVNWVRAQLGGAVQVVSDRIVDVIAPGTRSGETSPAPSPQGENFALQIEASMKDGQLRKWLSQGLPPETVDEVERTIQEALRRSKRST